MIDLAASITHGRGGGAASWLLLLLCSCAGSSAPQKGLDLWSSSDFTSGTDVRNGSDSRSSTGCDGACADLAPEGDSRTGCPAERQLCGTECVDLEVDRNNCGKCGQACQGAASCVAGNCACANGQPPPCEPCKTVGQACSGAECCEGLTCGYYGSSLACKKPDA